MGTRQEDPLSPQFISLSERIMENMEADSRKEINIGRQIVKDLKFADAINIHTDNKRTEHPRAITCIRSNEK